MAKKALPSKAQLKVLVAMRDGVALKRHRSTADGTEHVRFEPFSSKLPSIAPQTFTAMRLSGMICEQKAREAAEWWETWILAPLGLSALQEIERRGQGE